VTLPELAATARLVDKYHCHDAFRPTASKWLLQHLCGIGCAKTLPEYLGIAIAFRTPALEATVAFGIAITTGGAVEAYGNASRSQQRIQDTMLADLVPAEYGGKRRFYEEVIHSKYPNREDRPLSRASKHTMDA